MTPLTEEQIKFLDNVCCGKWEQTDKGVFVDGYVLISCHRIIYELPVKFYKITGYFCCSDIRLTKLKGCPEYVGGTFNCYNNKLTSLEGCPKYVGNGFYCYNNKLTSLEGIEEVKGRICCYNNKIDYKKEKEVRPEIYKKILYMKTLEKLLAES